MDIQLLLSSIRDQASAGRPAEARAQSQFQLQSQPQFHQPQSSPQASTFAQYLAQAGQRPEMTAPLRGESTLADAGNLHQVLEAGGDRTLHPPLEAGANLRGMANELWGMANERASLFADSSRNRLHGEISSQPGGRSRPSDLSQPLSTNAWIALLADQTSFAGLSSSTGQSSLARQIESLSADGSAVPFAEMTRDLSNSDYQRLVAELTKSLSAEDRDALLAQLSEQVGQFEQLEQLPAEEFQALFAQLAQAVPEHQR
ncbi:MAG: hypothetical protein ACLFQI_07160, partial [Halochromatium sp.]|uniref:hypothetical protein n=1 Tax=Halochromatium sp. TaxID=2049430 RepID=UPI00397E51CB